MLLKKICYYLMSPVIISVFTMLGEAILEGSFIENEATINISGWSSGIYFVRVQTKNGPSVHKLVKQ